MGILFGEPFIFPFPFLSCHSPWMAVKGVVGGMGLICTHDHVFFVTVAQLLPCLQDMNLADWSMVVFWNESAGSGSKKGPDIGLDFTDQPAPSPHVLQQPPATPGDDLDYPGYDDPHLDMPVDDEDMPPPNSAPEPDLDDDPIDL